MINKKNVAHIILYQDEFKINVWRSYCKIVGVEPNKTEKITLFFNKSLTKTN